MPSTNETLTFNSLPTSVRHAFYGGSARRTHLPAGTRLYKFTAFEAVGRHGISPWWAAVDPLPGFQDPGLDGHLRLAREAGMRTVDYVRDQFAVMLSWNGLGVSHLDMAKCVHLRLEEDLYGFAGICQRMHESASPRATGSLKPSEAAQRPPIHRGGAVQLYVPNLGNGNATINRTELIP